MAIARNRTELYHIDFFENQRRPLWYDSKIYKQLSLNKWLDKNDNKERHGKKSSSNNVFSN